MDGWIEQEGSDSLNIFIKSTSDRFEGPGREQMFKMV